VRLARCKGLQPSSLCRSRRAARPSALMHQKRNQTSWGERGYSLGKRTAKQLRRRRGRRVDIDRASNAEETVRVGGRTFPRLSRYARPIGTVNAEFGGGPPEGIGTGRSLDRCQREGQSLQDKRIRKHATKYAPQPPMRHPTHDIRPPTPTA
jgi:hypothetical protein